MDRLGNATNETRGERKARLRAEVRALLAGKPLPPDRAFHKPRRRRKAAPCGAWRRWLMTQLAAEQHGLCTICARPLGDLDACNIDHIIPVSRGGSNRRANLATTHITCNQRKGNSLA